MPKTNYGRKCPYCSKVVSTPCETADNSKKCANKKNQIKTITINQFTNLIEISCLLNAMVVDKSFHQNKNILVQRKKTKKRKQTVLLNQVLERKQTINLLKNLNY